MKNPKLSPTNSPTSPQVRKLSFDKHVPQLAKYTSTYSSRDYYYFNLLGDIINEKCHTTKTALKQTKCLYILC